MGTLSLRSRCRWFFPVLCLFCLSLRIEAQSAATLQAFEKGPHLGTVEQALVGLTVTAFQSDGTQKTRHGNGLMLRCDGYLLVPVGLFAYPADQAQPQFKVEVVLSPGTEQEQHLLCKPPPYYAYRRTKQGRFKVGYAVVRIDNVHRPALRTLLPDTLKPGDKAQLAWSPWDPTEKHFLPVQKRPVTLKEDEDKAHLAQSLMAFEEAQEGAAAGTEPDTPAGAVILGPEGKGIGLIPADTPDKRHLFLSFTLLGEVTNCVTPLPVPDQQFAKLLARRGKQRVELEEKLNSENHFGENLNNYPEAIKPMVEEETNDEKPEGEVETGKPPSAADMVSVSGGPIRLPVGLLEMQPDMGANQIACVAPFLIDKYEVTNRQYYAFWLSLPEKTRQDPLQRAIYYPVGWAESAPPFPAKLANVPVLGVHTEGAAAYAKWVGKRLPTPFEWCLAAYGPNGEASKPEWVQKYIQDRVQTWLRVRQAHLEYAREFGDPYKGADGWMLPWAIPTAPRAVRFSRQIIEQELEPIYQSWVNPQAVLPVGSRSFDVSPYGAMDMILNASELAQPDPAYFVPLRWTKSKRDQNLEFMQLEEGKDWFINIHWTRNPGRYLLEEPESELEQVSHKSGAIYTLWTAADLQTENVKGRREMLMARRVWNAPIPPPASAKMLLVDSYIYELSRMLHPVQNWEFCLTPGPTYRLLPTNPLFQLYEVAAQANPALAQEWNRPPPHFHQEMGRPVSAERAEEQLAAGFQKDTFLAPGGFRCAR